MKKNKSKIIIKRYYKEDLKKIEKMLGKIDTALVIHTVSSILEKIAENQDKLNLRTLEIVINDFFSRKFDFEKEEYVEDR